MPFAAASGSISHDGWYRATIKCQIVGMYMLPQSPRMIAKDAAFPGDRHMATTPTNTPTGQTSETVGNSQVSVGAEHTNIKIIPTVLITNAVVASLF